MQISRLRVGNLIRPRGVASRRGIKIVIAGLLFALALPAAIMLASAFLASAFQPVGHGRRPATASPVMAGGRIESDESHVAAPAAGRLLAVTVQEGDRVQRGQELVTIDDSLMRSALQSAKQKEALAAQMVAGAEAELAVLRAQIHELENGAPSIRLPAAEAEPDKPANSRSTGRKSRPLHIITAPLRIALKPLAAINPANSVKKQIALAQGKAEKMQTSALKIQSRMQLGSLKLMQSQAACQLVNARAELAKVEAARDQLIKGSGLYKICSPVDGICTACMVQPGDLVAAGQVLVTIEDPQKVYMRAFVPEGQIAAVKTGQAALVRLDSPPAGRTLKAHVSSIDQAACFTPESIYFPDDRVRQVFGLKLRIDNPDGSAKPGMPCQAEILTEASGT
jgi:HlyD family secretion protein